jgi:hypothetical protein
LHKVEIKKSFENIQKPFGFASFDLNNLSGALAFYRVCGKVPYVPNGVKIVG